MNFLDLDLDFFLNENAYRASGDRGRLGSNYKPWSITKVRYFLEYRCRMSQSSKIPGRTVESHDEVLDFWHALIVSGDLAIPFNVIHIDAHPDLWAGGGLSLTSEFLRVDSKHGLTNLKGKRINSGNYLTFAIAYGWIESLVWVPLIEPLKNLAGWDADARSILRQRNKEKLKSFPFRDSTEMQLEGDISFKVIPWQRFRTSEMFDYVALSMSPNFTPPESDRLITVIEEYIIQK